MTTEICRGFVFATSAFDLWAEIKELLGVCNGPMLYELRRQIYSAKQGSDSVAVYYNKIKRLWDELLCWKPNLRMYDNEEERMIAYGMVVKVENQRRVQNLMIDSGENSAMQVNVKVAGEGTSVGEMANTVNNEGHFQSGRRGYQGVRREDRSQLKFDYCGKMAHVKAVYYRLKGSYYDKTRLGHQESNEWKSMINNMVQQQVDKAMQGKGHEAEADCANLADFSGSVLTLYSNLVCLSEYNFWIVDSGASTHMCSSLNMFDSYKNVEVFTPVHLLDNITNPVKAIGTIKLQQDIKPLDCLFVPAFKHNLLYDSKASKVLGIVREDKGLYILDFSSFSSKYVDNVVNRKVYDLTTKVVVVFKDVIFNESLFPFSPDLKKSSLVPTSENVDHTKHRECLPIVHVDVIPFYPVPAVVPCTSSVPLDHDPITSQAPKGNASPVDSNCTDNTINTRHSNRTRQASSWLNDFVVNTACDSAIHVYSAAHIFFLANLSKFQVPYSFKQAQLSSDWVKAMEVELAALEQNDTWDIVDLPQGYKPIGCKWVYKLKCWPDRRIDKYKARLVGKGYNQIEGIDYFCWTTMT
ncbi:hypothetical protein LIER_21832 [Lithospermum erythrorhizon]|uniref:Polyprotein n=1 Tax=Lithospermum erythrorhizon TaxID=34254 RepID=A0AAV3QUR1_LITER